MSDAAKISFPCRTFPEETRTQRLLGIYPMRQEGLLMQRVKAPSGQITLPQWRTLAELAREHTQAYPLHLTTRQDIELHGLKQEQIASVQDALNTAGLTSARTGGDSLRNVVCCPGSGLCATGVDVLPLAAAIRAACEAEPHIHALPRKFKISLSACGQSCGRPWIQDVGLIHQADGTFKAIVGGSLGARPGTGIEYLRPLKLEEVVPFVLGAFRLFYEEGDRKFRTRARLRHVRERLGNEAFLHRLDSTFQNELSKGRPFIPPQPFPPEGRSLLARLNPPLGDVFPEEAFALAQAADSADALLRIGLAHDLHLYGRDSLDLSDTLRAWTEKPAVVSCPGTTWCSRGIADSRCAAQEIVAGAPAASDLQVSLSGCPNNCAQSAVADIGLVGCIKTVEDVRTECFRLLAGGGLGMNAQLAHELHSAVPASRVSEAIQWLVEECGKTGSISRESFAGFVAQEKERLSHGLALLLGT